ncbi:MAG: hypothetical protein P8163_10585 [Candidatus Thiodiazotropha sp.]
MFDYNENRFDVYGHLLGESRYSVNGTLIAAPGGVATPWNSRLLQGVARRAGMHKCRGHMDVQERPLPCTTTSAPFTLPN